VITTENSAWGFFGTVAVTDVAGAAELFDATARELMAQLGLTADEARTALDSKVGRHIADQRGDGEDAAALIAHLIRKGWSGDIRRAAGQRAPKSPKGIALRVQPDKVAILRFAPRPRAPRDQRGAPAGPRADPGADRAPGSGRKEGAAMITFRGIAIAMTSALEPTELAQLAERLMEGATELEMRADEDREGRSKILARRAAVLGELSDAIEIELEKTEARS